jgi:hypothetical protein
MIYVDGRPVQGGDYEVPMGAPINMLKPICFLVGPFLHRVL